MSCFPSKNEFIKSNIPLPIYKNIDIEMDDLSPFDCFREVSSGRYSFLLESTKGAEGIGRYSFIGTEPYLIFKSKGKRIEIIEEDEKKIISGSPIDILKDILRDKRIYRNNIDLPPFFGGAVGFFSYDLVHFFEKLPQNAKDDLNLPDIYLIFVDSVVVFDHLKKGVKIIYSFARDLFYKEDREMLYYKGIERIEYLEKRLRKCKKNAENGAIIKRDGVVGATPLSSFTKEEYMDIVERCKEYIKAGDIFQANLSQRFCINIVKRDPIEIYSLLRRINPSPFSSYIDFDGLNIVSSSPERLVRLRGRDVETRPIAGTRPRGTDKHEETRFTEELFANEKERAEHIMLIDLERNDLGRVCEYGSIRVDEFMVPEYYSHVIHIVSNIRGRLHKGRDCFDLIRAVFPGGTITGVPKVRCMEIINELEPVTRGPYTGSIGYISLSGDMDMNIIIRSIIIKNKYAYIHVGAGIVADSDPEREYYETLFKAEAMLKALTE
ncbi:MAG: anthranilate synthase component I family protein [Nitrospirota bacterium]